MTIDNGRIIREQPAPGYKLNTRTRMHIDPNERFTAKTVLQMIGTVQNNDLISGTLLARHLEDSLNLLHGIRTWCQRIYDAVTLVGAGEKLQAWLTKEQAHSELISLAHRINVERDDQQSNNIHFFDLDGLAWAEFVGSVERLARACLKASKDSKNGGDAGASVVNWINEDGLFLKKQLVQIGQMVHLGGRPDSPELRSLYKISYAFMLQNSPKWKEIANDVWKQISTKGASERSEDEQIVYQAWQDKTVSQRRAQIKRLGRQFQDTRLMSI